MDSSLAVSKISEEHDGFQKVCPKVEFALPGFVAYKATITCKRGNNQLVPQTSPSIIVK